MSKCCLVNKGVLKIIELPKFLGICSDIVSIADIPESVIVFEDVCDKYQILADKYVFYVAKGEQYIYNLSNGEKRKLNLPQRVVNVAKCTNPRCITSIEKDLDQVFNLTDKENEVYRCLYCESSLKNKE